MTRTWLVVLLAGVATVLLKSAGALIAGGRAIPPTVRPILARLAPALFGALIATQAFVRDGALVIDARIGGLAAAALGVRLGLPPALVLAGAVAITAASRQLH